MKPTKTQVTQMLIEKLSGMIDPEADLVIKSLILEDDTVREEWKQLQKLEGSSSLPDPNVNTQWQKLRQRMKKPAKAKIFSLPRIAAAAIAIFFFVTYYFQPAAKQFVLAEHEKSDSDRVYLQSSTGEIAYVDINQKIEVGGTTISAKTDSLSFIAGNSDGLYTLSVPRAKYYFIKLSDGTSITLNSKTILRFPFRFPGKTREVYVEGEAYFNVAKDKDHPFIVHADQNQVEVLGTEFNVNTYDISSVKTSLVKGSVMISNSHSKLHLKPGFEATDLANKAFEVKRFEPSEVLSWMQGRYYFHNASLQELSSLLSRWYKVKVIFGNPKHRKRTFSGEILKSQPVEFFLENLKLSNNVPLRYKDGVVLFP